MMSTLVGISILLLMTIVTCRSQASQVANTSEILCEDLGIPADSCVEYIYKDNKYEVNSTWIFRCTYVFYAPIFGIPRPRTQEIVCQPDGQWSAPIPSCVIESVYAPFCSHPFGEDTLMYQIGWNFTVQGKNVTCMDDGKWGGHISHCKSEYYRHLNGLDDTQCPNIFGEKACSKVGETVSVGSCGEADKQFTCGKRGKWVGKIPKCFGQHYEWFKWRFPTGQTIYKLIDGSERKAPFVPAFPESSPVGTFPWQAALAANNSDNIKGAYNGWFIYCSGSLVSDKWVLTAAHCLTEKGRKVLRSLDDTVIFLGKHFRNHKMDDEHVKEVHVKKLLIHPRYEPATFNNDIGLVELDAFIDFSERIRPICLPQLGSYSPLIELQQERYAMTAGWGKNHLNEPNEDLGHVLVKFANVSECSPGSGTDSNLFFCGKPFDDKSGGWACPGDSGGPLIFQELVDGLDRFIVEGIVSWGSETCTTTKTAFIKVRPYLCWIKDIIQNGHLMDSSPFWKRDTLLQSKSACNQSNLVN